MRHYAGCAVILVGEAPDVGGADIETFAAGS